MNATGAGEVGAIDQRIAAWLVNAVMAELMLASLAKGRQSLPAGKALILGVLKGMEGAA